MLKDRRIVAARRLFKAISETFKDGPARVVVDIDRDPLAHLKREDTEIINPVRLIRVVMGEQDSVHAWAFRGE